MPFPQQWKKQAQKLLDTITAAYVLPEPLSVSQWAERYRRLSGEASAQKGRWVNRPFQAEVMDLMSKSSQYNTIVLMMASQMFKTEALLNFGGYIIMHDPGPTLVVEPSEQEAEAFSKDRVAPMLSNCPELRDLVSAAKSRDSDNTIFHKKFEGGHITFVGARSPSSLAMRPIRYALLDELDRWPDSVGAEGDPVSLVIRRTDEFRRIGLQKIVMASSPTTEKGAIYKWYKQSNQFKPYVPCPFCKHMQVLEFESLLWPKGAPEKAKYKCAQCEKLIPHSKKLWMLHHGRLHAENPDSKIAGVWISKMYSISMTWAELAEEFLAKKEQGELALKTFYNTALARPWVESSIDTPDWEKLMSRREPYRLGKVPQGVLFLTAGADVQRSWGEVFVWGWGRGKQRWLVDHIRINHGPYDPKFWEEMNECAGRVYGHPSGVQLPIIRFAIDTGHETNEVYAWVRKQGAGRVLAVDGRPSGISMVAAPSLVDVTIGGRKIKHGCKIWPVNVSMCKSELYGLLRQDRPAEGQAYPSGWVHYPSDVGAEFFKQLTGEDLKFDEKRRRYHWEKNRDRNEALDCANYARAAASQFGIDRFTEARWRQLEQDLGVEHNEIIVAVESVVIDDSLPFEEAPLPVVAARPTPPPAQPAKPRQRVTPSNWMRSFLG